ncbi:MAG: sugar kinase [Planctomycetota bacterium]
MNDAARLHHRGRVYVANTAVGLAGLGHSVAWISRLNRNPIGRRISREIADHNVDVSRVLWTDQDRVGTYFYQPNIANRQAQVWYDRADSAFSNCRPEDIVTALQRLRTKAFHTTGISIGVSESAFRATLKAIDLMRSRGSQISFDVNYRGKLLGIELFRERLQHVLPLCQFIYIPLRDSKAIFGVQVETAEEAAKHLSAILPAAHIVVTNGAHGSTCRCPDGRVLSQPAYSCQTVERLGLGDAFSAGFLSGWLTSRDPAFSLKRAALMASLKFETTGDFPSVSAEQIANEERNPTRQPIRASSEVCDIER